MSVAYPIRISGYAPQWRTEFARLNLEWLEAHFVVEPIDRIVLLDPETHILEPGGRILFAIRGNDLVVGTVALKREGEDVYELTKMAVDPACRGHGIGRQLMLASLTAFQQLGGHELFLESSSKLAPALRLYESVGFEHRPAPRPGSHYQRADIYMVWRALPSE
ncbi:MAG: GNAT family N-acetyltransferase [Pseudomonadota bacterium]|nr:GNAT family N-acetyltransferase [Pseudomonadota bacterium]